MFAKTTKVVVTALVLAGALVTAASAAPQKAPSQNDQLWFDRASNPNAGGGSGY